VLRLYSGAMFVFRSVQTRVRRIRRTGFARKGDHRLFGRSTEAKARKGLSAAAKGEAYTPNGRTWTYALGLREAGTAKRNGSTAARKTNALYSWLFQPITLYPAHFVYRHLNLLLRNDLAPPSLILY
jgi:hypothetical protein